MSTRTTRSTYDDAYEDHTAKSPFERVARDVEDVVKRWVGETSAGAGDARMTTPNVASCAIDHEMHWRKERYECARWSSGDDESECEGVFIDGWRANEREAKASSVDVDVEVVMKASLGASDCDFRKMFGITHALVIRPLSASKEFFDMDEALTVRAAFTLAMASVGAGGSRAVITPRGERASGYSGYSGDVCDDDGGDAVLESDVMRFTRFSTGEEEAARTYVGFINRYMKQVRSARASGASAEAIDAEGRDVEQSLVSARITLSLNASTSSQGKDRDDASADDSDIEDMRSPLGDGKRKNVHESLDDSDFGLFLDEWDDDCPWSPWVNMEDPWRSLALDAIWPAAPLETMYAFSELDIEDAPKWFLRGDLTQAARDRGEEDDDLLSRDTSTMSEMLYDLIRNAESVADEEGLDTDALAGIDYWTRNDLEVPSLPNDKIYRGVIRSVFDSPSTSDSAVGRATEPSKSAPSDTLLTRLALHACLLKNARAVAHLWNAFTRELRYAYWERGREIPAVLFDQTLGIDHQTCVLNQKLQLLNECIRRRNKRSESDLQSSAVYIEKQQSQVAADWDIAGGGWSGGEDDVDIRAASAPPRDELDELTMVASSTTKNGWGVDAEIDLNALLSDDAPLTSLTRGFSESGAGKMDECDEYASADERLSDADDALDGERDVDAEGIFETTSLRLITPPHAFMHAPITQESPVYTEDMLVEREASMSAFGDDDEGRAARQRMQSDSLRCDMSAFKAANPRATFEDFVRWHSPKDWESTSSSAVSDVLKPEGSLSARMRHEGNTWMQLWNDAPRCPARRQTLLFDPVVEGEKALHHLETAPAPALFAQLARCAFSAILALYASADASVSSSIAADAIRTATDTCSAFFARSERLMPEDYDCAVYALQLAERAVARATSLHKKIPDVAASALRARLLDAASQWERARARDVSRASTRAITSECLDAGARAALRRRLPSVRPPCLLDGEFLAHSPLSRRSPFVRVHAMFTRTRARFSSRVSSS